MAADTYSPLPLTVHTWDYFVFVCGMVHSVGLFSGATKILHTLHIKKTVIEYLWQIEKCVVLLSVVLQQGGNPPVEGGV